MSYAPARVAQGHHLVGGGRLPPPPQTQEDCEFRSPLNLTPMQSVFSSFKKGSLVASCCLSSAGPYVFDDICSCEIDEWAKQKWLSAPLALHGAEGLFECDLFSGRSPLSDGDQPCFSEGIYKIRRRLNVALVDLARLPKDVDVCGVSCFIQEC